MMPILVYNSHNSEMSLLNNRIRIDRRRVEDAFFQYALLRTASMYPDMFALAELPLHADTRDTLSKFTTVYHKAFMDRYASMYHKYLIS